MGRLDDRVIIVTGGAQGIGLAYCKGLAAEGAKVVVADIDKAGSEAAVGELGEAGADALAVVGDVSNPEDTEEMARATMERFGRIDGLVFSSGPDALLVQMLLQTPGIKLANFGQAEAYARRLPFLSHVVLPRGIVDLGRDLPPQDYQLIAPTATLVARSDLHPALVELFVQAAGEIHGGAGWFQKQGQFPSSQYTEIPVSREAAKYYKDGPPLLQRYMPFWVANLLDRLWVVVIALAALIIPFSKVVPPLYVWRIKSRLYRWYGQLRVVEQQLDEAEPEQRAAVCATLLKRLDDIEERVNHMSIPLAFADNLYGLRSHINFVRQRVNLTLKQAEETAQTQPPGILRI